MEVAFVRRAGDIEGIAQECITSFEDAKICKRISIGIATAPVPCSLIIFEIPFFNGT